MKDSEEHKESTETRTVSTDRHATGTLPRVASYRARCGLKRKYLFLGRFRRDCSHGKYPRLRRGVSRRGCRRKGYAGEKAMPAKRLRRRKGYAGEKAMRLCRRRQRTKARVATSIKRVDERPPAPASLFCDPRKFHLAMNTPSQHDDLENFD